MYKPIIVYTAFVLALAGIVIAGAPLRAQAPAVVAPSADQAVKDAVSACAVASSLADQAEADQAKAAAATKVAQAKEKAATLKSKADQRAKEDAADASQMRRLLKAHDEKVKARKAEDAVAVKAAKK